MLYHIINRTSPLSLFGRAERNTNFVEWVAAGAAATSAIGSIINSATGNSTNKKIARENRAWSEEMWNKNNEYNTPSAQMARYTAAGVNPYLAVSDGSVGSGTSSSPADADGQAPYQGFDLTASGTQFQNALLLASQKKNIEADTSQKNAQTTGQNLQNALDFATFDEKVKSPKLQNKLNELNADFLQQTFQGRVLNVNLQNQQLQEDIALKRVQTSSLKVQTQLSEFARDYLQPVQLQQAQLDLQKTMAQTEAFIASSKLSYSQAKYFAVKAASAWYDSFTARISANAQQTSANASMMNAANNFAVGASQVANLSVDTSNKVTEGKILEEKLKGLKVSVTNQIIKDVIDTSVRTSDLGQFINFSRYVPGAEKVLGISSGWSNK